MIVIVMCRTKQSSVINLIHSRQELFSYTDCLNAQCCYAQCHK